MIDRKSILIVALLIVVNFMTVGYALMAAELEQKNNDIVENRKAKWNVEISEVSIAQITGQIESVSSEIENSLSAKFSTKTTDKTEKEAYLIYAVKVVNTGTMDAYLNNISYSEDERATLLIDGIKVNDILKSGESIVFTITVKNNNEALGENEIINDFFITLDYKSK